MAKRVEKGTVLGDRFRLVELIGGGGMGSVYAAYDLDQGYRVAVKVLNPRLARRTEFRERFLSESRMATSIPHPHILTVYDHGEDDGWHYLAMRLVETDLATLLSREGRLDPTRALNLADQVAWALDVAHAQGLVHRDVKPENVLVTPRRTPDEPDQAYLCDFGIAKLESADLGLTRTGAFIGTVNYASPEHAAGEKLDGRSDQYSLACVLFECLTGDPPFTARDSDGVLAAHQGEERPRVSARSPGLPAGLDAVLARGLACDREDRFPTCRELVAAARREVRAAPAARAAALAETVAEAPPAGLETEAATTAPLGGAPPTPPAPPTPARPAPPPPATPVPEPSPAGRGRRRPLLPAAVALVALVTAGVLAAVLLSAGDGSGSAAAFRPPTTAPRGSEDREAAEDAVRQTVLAYAAAQGEKQVCATLTKDEATGCDTAYVSAQPASYAIRRVEVGDERATAKVLQTKWQDPIEFSLVRERGRWLIDDIDSFAWKDAEAIQVATTVERFGHRDAGACGLLSRAAAGQCRRLLPRRPVAYDIQSVSASSSTGSVTAKYNATDSDYYSLEQELGEWKISGIS